MASVSRQPGQRLAVLGVPVDRVTRGEAESWLRRHLDRRDPGLRHLVTLNPEYIMAAQRDDHFKAALGRADLVTADGVGVVFAGRLATPAVKLDRFTGVELTAFLMSVSGEYDAPLFLLGAGRGVAESAAERLRHESPGGRIAGAWDGGSPDPRHDEQTIQRIAAAGARILLVAYGAPGQVFWIERNRDALEAAGVLLAAGVGGAFDFIAGTVPRAPGPIRAVGLEWLYRLVRQPWRWRRQLALPLFVVAILKDRPHAT